MRFRNSASPRRIVFVLAAVLALVALGLRPAPADDAPIGDAGQMNEERARKLHRKPSYCPYAGRNYPTRVFWGDTHLHTELSMDAGAFGNRLGMDEAYRFAKGEEVVPPAACVPGSRARSTSS